MEKQYAVFGLGSFGTSVALTLESFGCSVIVVDKSADKIQDISDDVSYAVTADLSNPEVLLNLGLSHVDVAIVATSDSLEVSILATIISKELGIPHVIVKATDELHATVFQANPHEIMFDAVRQVQIRHRIIHPGAGAS